MYLQYTSRSQDDFWRAVHSAVMWPCSPHTHTITHTTCYVQNSAFEQSIANTWSNNKTYLVADSEATDCHSKVRIYLILFFYFFRNSLRAQAALYSTRFTKQSSIICVAQILKNWGGGWTSLNFYKEYLFGFETLVFATLGISSMHEQLVTLQRERKTWNRIIRAL